MFSVGVSRLLTRLERVSFPYIKITALELAEQLLSVPTKRNNLLSPLCQHVNDFQLLFNQVDEVFCGSRVE